MFDLQASEFFNNLPEMYKESIMQSGVEFSSEADLCDFANHLGHMSSLQ